MTTETTFDLLGNPVRRNLLAILRESSSIERDRLTATLAAEAGDATGFGASEGTEEARHRMRIALHHNHLPRLADAGLVTYDEETVTATNRLKAVASLLHSPDDRRTTGDEATPASI
ncbi:DUF7344 domain-containing protein [Halorussus litoreus]|uniref:DUF7344 domain-containing protein n=1 Tax=Halorussus litoreus TaxID=1710536 RepID=UPI000E2517E3|nr:hypothetical protein [Halorussus litoreus]